MILQEEYILIHSLCTGNHRLEKSTPTIKYPKSHLKVLQIQKGKKLETFYSIGLFIP